MSHLKLFLLILVGCTVAAFAGDLLHHPNPLRRSCGFPTHAYHSTSQAPSKIVYDIAKADNNSGSGVAGSPILKTFQFDQARLNSDHCSIRQLTLTITSDGDYTINFKATQNPGDLAVNERTQFERYVQNSFHLTFKALGADRSAENPSTMKIGSAELFRIEPAHFWITKGQTKSFRITNQGQSSAELKAAFPLIQSVEAEFYYQ